MSEYRPEEMYANFTHNIVALRRAHGLTKKAMAQILEISLYSLNQIEKGQIPSNLGLEALVAAAIYFRISAEDLLTRRLG